MNPLLAVVTVIAGKFMPKPEEKGPGKYFKRQKYMAKKLAESGLKIDENGNYVKIK